MRSIAIRRRTLFVLLAIAAALAINTASAASFDCAKAVTPTEKAICADPVLSRLDEQLDDAYRVAQKRASSRIALRDAQRTWLATRRDVCRDSACLRDAYEARIDALLDESRGNPTTETLEINATKAREPYTTSTTSCAGFPRLNIGMAAGMCAGLVTGPTQGNPTRRIRMPRSLLELDANTWLVTDLGAWTGKTGAVWRIRINNDGSITLDALVKGLQLPHTLAWGPDHLVYVSEMGRIFRFDPHAADPAATLETVIGNLPDNRLHAHRHPIAAFVFDADGALLVNVGAPSDQCLDENDKPAAPTCAESEQDEQVASIRRYALAGPGKWNPKYTVHARGLRNSVALARHSSGTILQGENSFDFEARLRPFEEINVIQAGRHYGWPYCFDNDQPSPGWKGLPVAVCSDAKRYTAPALLLPPHSSPLALVWYDGPMFPQLQGKLLVSWHGFRSVGGRIAAFATGATGVPTRSKGAKFPAYGGPALPYGAANSATATILTPEWNKVVGVRPQGSPVGLAVAKDGAIWTTDDRAGLVIRIAADASLVLPGSFAQATTVADFEKLFGKSNVRIIEQRDAVGKVHRSLVLFPDDPTRRATVSFHDDEGMEGVANILVDDAGSLWRGKQGVRVGMSFADLRKANGKPFYFSGFDDQHRGWVRDQWSASIDDDDNTLGAMDVEANDHMYFGVDLGLRGGGKDIPAAAYPKEDSTSSDDPRYPRLGEIVEVTAITAFTSLDDEWD